MSAAMFIADHGTSRTSSPSPRKLSFGSNPKNATRPDVVSKTVFWISPLVDPPISTFWPTSSESRTYLGDWCLVEFQYTRPSWSRSLISCPEIRASVAIKRSLCSAATSSTRSSTAGVFSMPMMYHDGPSTTSRDFPSSSSKQTITSSLFPRSWRLISLMVPLSSIVLEEARSWSPYPSRSQPSTIPVISSIHDELLRSSQFSGRNSI